MGFLCSGDIEVKGGKSLHFKKNMIEFVQKKSAKMEDVKSVKISGNYFGFPISDGAVSISYSGATPRCLSGPVPYSSIEELDMSSNLVTRHSQLLSLHHPYSQDPPLVMSSTTILAPCLCTNTSLYLGEGEQCLSQAGRLGPRSEVCRGGETGLGGECGSARGGVSPVFVGVLAALLAALVTAVLVGAGCWLYGIHTPHTTDEENKREA